MKLIRLISLALTALSGCTSQQPTPTQGTCVVAHESGFVGAEHGQVQITVGQNGSPCVTAASIGRGSMGQGEIATPPAHGSAAVNTTAEATLISYTPARGYVGADQFEVAFGPNFTVTVVVQVVPVAPK